MMLGVPLVPEQAGGSEDPVHLHFVFPGPECQLHRQRHIRFRLRGVMLLPVTGPQISKELRIARGVGLFQDLLVTELLDGTALFLALLLSFLGRDKGLLNPRQCIRQGLGHRIHAAGYRLLRHREIPGPVIHLNAGLGVLAAALRLGPFEPQVNPIAGGRELHVCRLPRHDRLRGLIESIGFRIIAVVHIDADVSVLREKHKADAVVAILFSGCAGGLVITP